MSIRFSAFNASLNRSEEGELIQDLSSPDNAQAQTIAEIIQRTNPDVLLINEFDYDSENRAAELFQENYLSVSQNGLDPVEYPYVYVAPSNTGIASGFDLDNNGEVGGPGDAFGFGFFPGQFGMALFSKYPIDTENIRTFQTFLWRDMPGALLPDDPATPEPQDWYSAEELDVFRLSSKSHWDVPINVNGDIIHALVSHPTPPVFDGPEDRNGTRNFDEIRFWADYINGADYIYDDAGDRGGLAPGSRFVIMGDQNADPFDGDSIPGAIQQILNDPLVNTTVSPASLGGPDAAERQGSNNLTQLSDPAYDTADFGEAEFGGPGNLRVDYVLPSTNLEITEAGVFWPTADGENFDLVGDFPFPSSDHRLVFADVNPISGGASQNRVSVRELELLGEVSFATGTELESTEIGGLSGIAYDRTQGVYYSLADDRSSEARFYTLTIDLNDGSLDDGDIVFQSVTQLLDESGEPFAEGVLDPEGIALTGIGTLYIASEGDTNQLIDPFVRQFSITGQQISALPVPAKYSPTADQTSGIRNNLAFESLTLTPNQRYLYTATENALFQDGPAATLDDPSLSRILKYDLSTGQPVAEFVYEVEAVPDVPIPTGAFSTNGLVELLALDNNGTFLALERAFSVGVGNTVKLYQVNTQGALDVFAQADLFREEAVEVDDEILPPGPFVIDPAVIKTELLDIEADLGIEPDNLEGIALGPVLPDGRQSLIVVSDNNFSDTQKTQFIALALELGTTPAAQPVVETAYTIDDNSFQEFTPLNILLVNDDGFESEGIQVMYDALVEAGHTVTLVAPKEQQSGQGTRINVDSIFQPTEVVEFAPGQWYVDGTPVTTTLAALDFILDGEAPDLVISGINEGENVGANIAISSGTVSAAATALQRDIPAIAVSAGTARDENFDIDTEALEQAYEVGAQTVLDLIAKLQRTGGETLLPEGVGLNVNIPARAEEIEGVALTRLDGTGTFDLFVSELAPGTPGLLFRPGMSLEPEEITVADSEGQNFLADFITVTPIDGDWSGSENDRVRLSDRLASAPEDATATPLNILLTNDDGFDSAGIEALYEALTAAGHTVTLVGPFEQQSGTGTSLDVDKILQPLDIVNVEEDKWYVDAGVRTTTWAGLDFILDGEAPDLVISGINEGENIGPGGAVSSGTVSAAVTALLRDVPAIAISGGISFTDETAVEAAYEAGSAYITTLIAQLQATQGSDTTLLPEGLGLSINVPVRFPEGITEIQGVAITDANDITPFVIDFGPVEGGAGLRFIPASLPEGDIDPTSEGGQFLSGFITVTPIDGDWTAPDLQAETVDAQLSAPDPVLAGDSDDPAIWVHPTDPSQSVVFATLKDGGLVSFDLEGNILETYLPADFGDIRYNNVDLVYGFTGMGMAGAFQTDLAVVSDRENDTLVILQIDPETGAIADITSPNIPETIFGVDDGEATAYGLATYTSPVTGKSYAFVTQASGNRVAQLELIPEIGPADEFFVNAEVVRTIELPVPTGDPEDSQSEGLVVDQELGLFYVALENEVGILRFSAEPDVGNDFTVVQSVEADYLVPDIEGLNIYYGPNGTGYLIANSQGDSSYAVFTREGTNEYLGSFIVGGNGNIDQVNESDGLDVINVPLGPNFPNGLLVLQDGANDPQNAVQDEEELENNSTNFKFVPWDSVADAFANPLLVDPGSFDPRNPEPQSLVNGVASGDVTQDSVVLWARSTFPGTVTFEYSTDATFSTMVGTATADVTDINQPVKVDVTGLDANTEYFYRVMDAAGDMETGRFQTAAAAGEQVGLTFGIAGDWQQAPPYPILQGVGDRNLDFFVKLGDTIYADLETPATPGVSQARTLEQFRAKHSEILSPRFGLSAVSDLYSTTSIFATIDDHEVVDNFAGGAAPGESPDAPDIGSSPDPLFTDDVEFVNDTQAYEDAMQAYQEYHPLQDQFYDTPEDSRTDGERKLYRAQEFGSDAALFMLDSRSFRDVQLPPADLSNPTEFLVNAFDPTRTLLGRAQVELLKQDLLAADQNGVTWKFVTIPEPIQNFGVVNAEDRFEGYAAERTEILKFINDNDIDNVVFMAGDFHGTIVNNLTYQEAPGQAQIATNAFEVVTGPVAFFDGRFGPNVANLSAAAGFINPEELAFYNALPVAPDTDSIVNDKDDFIKQLLIGQTTLFGYDPVGLDNNLEVADGLVNATLLQGDYLAAHNYSWTEFDIDPVTQTLTVTTFGIDAYSEADVLANPDAVLNLTPRIISQFEVVPQSNSAPGPSLEGQVQLELAQGEQLTLAGFGGVGRGAKISLATVDELDTIRFIGDGLTAEKMQLTQNGADLEITFLDDETGTKAVLQDFALDQLDNLLMRTGGTSDRGNIIFSDETDFADSFDVFNADSTQTHIWNRNSVTFLNDMDNTVHGFNGSNDVINGLGGNDTLSGRSGDDILRGGDGDDILDGGLGDDIYTGGAGADIFKINARQGVDTITDYEVGVDQIVLGSSLNPGSLRLLEVDNNTLVLTNQNELLFIIEGQTGLGNPAFG